MPCNRHSFKLVNNRYYLTGKRVPNGKVLLALLEGLKKEVEKVKEKRINWTQSKPYNMGGRETCDEILRFLEESITYLKMKI